jgi:hypothetical protein
LLKGGKVLDMWHYNSFPSFEGLVESYWVESWKLKGESWKGKVERESWKGKLKGKVKRES